MSFLFRSLSFRETRSPWRACWAPEKSSLRIFRIDKLDIAKAFGADVVLNAEKTTPEERIARIKAETNGRGAEIVVECVGRPEVFPEGLKVSPQSRHVSGAGSTFPSLP